MNIYRTFGYTKKEILIIFLLPVPFLLLFNHFTSASEYLNNDQALILEGAFFVSLTLSFHFKEKLTIYKRRRMAYAQICPALRSIEENLLDFKKHYTRDVIASTDFHTSEIAFILQNAHRLDQAVQTFSDTLDEELIRRVNYLAVSLTSIERESPSMSYHIPGLLLGVKFTKSRLTELNVNYDLYLKKHDDFIISVNNQKL